MIASLPPAIADYVDAVNRKDTDAMLAAFANTAVVEDDGQELRGKAPIKAWLDQTTAEYGISLEVLDVSQQGEDVTMTTLASGNFEGSPFRFQYHFKVAEGKITALRIDFVG